jgi:Cu2+-containing amine oxidase
MVEGNIMACMGEWIRNSRRGRGAARSFALIALVFAGRSVALAQSAPCPGLNDLTQGFPTAGPEVTRWHLCWDVERMPDASGAPNQSETLVIRDAGFRPAPGVPEVQVIGDMRIAEVFVPYHHSGLRLNDLTGGAGFVMNTLSSVECPGTLLADSTVCLELRDRGLAWRDPFLGTARRGEMLVLWSILNASNYDYVMEYSFLDDGSIYGRAGSTGRKLRGADDREGHMHNFAWRLNLDIDGPAGDTVFLASHVEDGLSGEDSDTRINLETGIGLNAKQFPHLKVVDGARKNGRGRKTGWELSPSREGIASHKEGWTKSPFWVTLNHGPDAELRARDLKKYVNGESVVNKDVVVWYVDSHHHEDDMRDEDRDTVPVQWLGFKLEPQNLFDRTPFYP